MNFFQRLFSQPKVEAKPEIEAQVDERVDDSGHKQICNISQLAPGLHVGQLSDIGREREQNEDSFLVLNALIQHDYGQEPFGLFIVADGMGGHQKGEVASALATRTVANHILQDVYLPYLTQNNRSSANRPINEALVAAVQSANTAVQEAAPDGGTTLTATLMMGNNAYVAHVGDTRAYMFKQDEVKQITKDHSLAQRLEELGQATPGEVAHVKNVLYKAIGQNSTVEVDTYIQHLPPGSSLLLCSDGLWGLVEDDVLKDTINSSATPQEACERLVAMANQKGGQDNITAVIVTMGVES
jgi:serine/threonine protein phosphatase PrpC